MATTSTFKGIVHLTDAEYAELVSNGSLTKDGQTLTYDAGTLYVTDATSCNPNLLINGDFLVNQRGLSSYTTDAKYTVDRWQQNDCTVSVVDGGLKVSVGGSITQRLETLKGIGGKTCTLSCMINSTLCQVSFTFDTSAGYTALETFSNGWQLAYSGSAKYVRLQNVSGSADDIVVYVKLELGSTATAYSPRSYAEELAMCQRYFQKLRINGNLSIATSTSTIYTGLPLPVSMRTAPTITNINQTSIREIGVGIKGNVDVAYSTLYNNILQLQASVSSLNISSNAGIVWANGEITADSEIY